MIDRNDQATKDIAILLAVRMDMNTLHVARLVLYDRTVDLRQCKVVKRSAAGSGKDKCEANYSRRILKQKLIGQVYYATSRARAKR
mmetsp:Transcript_1439/g.3432  ORF Transcript_1439/g.3432 Transcript_1439/m.3432 type:complete len:86 (+) Transcript_1439:5526-5783(+)